MPQHDLYANFKRLLEEYGEEIRTDLNLAILETSNDTLRNLKAVSPVLTGSYRKGWRKKMETTRWDSSSVVFYNETDWQLTHLLNTGHSTTTPFSLPTCSTLGMLKGVVVECLVMVILTELKSMLVIY